MRLWLVEIITTAGGSRSPARGNVQIERTFDAPIDLVWAMWTEAEHFANWYGPMGAKIPKVEMDVQVGGGRHIAMEMETPGGPMQMFFVGEYREVDPKTRLVYTESMADADGNPMTAEQMGMPAGAHMQTSIVVELEDLGDRTKMTMTHIGVPADSPGGQGWAMVSTYRIHPAGTAARQLPLGSRLSRGCAETIDRSEVSIPDGVPC